MGEIDNRYRIIFSVICNRRRIGRRGSFREDHEERSIIQFIISRRCWLYEEIAGAAYQRGECRFTASVCLLGSDAGRRCNGTSVQRCGRNPEGRTRKKSSSGSAIVLYDIESGIPDVRRRTGSAVIDGALDNSSIVVTVADHTVHFRLVDATTEQNNNKESKDKKRVFMLFTEDEENHPGIKTF